MAHIIWVAAFLLGHATYSSACEVLARTESGQVCGVKQKLEDGSFYASFRGVQYAKQPLGELRFKELQPVEPWEDVYNATTEGPVCPQTDILYGLLMQPQGMSEACIHANIHVPHDALPNDSNPESPGLPIYVYIHGGAFQYGSGDADVYGPEYLVSKDIMVVTFNYRLNVFGFLSLNSSLVPGNAGLRDMVTLLRWVRANARHFGGNPDNVTVGGQSAGACSAHLLSLSTVTEGLFKREQGYSPGGHESARKKDEQWTASCKLHHHPKGDFMAILQSGTGTVPYFSTSPAYSQFVAQQLLTALGINSTDPVVVHNQLVATPVESIIAANAQLQNQLGLNVFVPVVESSYPGVTQIIEDKPETLIKRGRGQNIPLIVGFTTVEAEIFRKTFEQLNFLELVKHNASALLPPRLTYGTPSDKAQEMAEKLKQKYFNGSFVMADVIKYATEAFFQYPAMKLAQRVVAGGAPVYLYQFSHNSQRSVLKVALGLNYTGASHIEDLTYAFRTNSVLGNDEAVSLNHADTALKEQFSSIMANFVRHGVPIDGCSGAEWPPMAADTLTYQDFRGESNFFVNFTPEQKDMLQFFEDIQFSAND